MGLFSSLTKIVGGAIGGAVGGPVGAGIGSSLGGSVGGLISGVTGKGDTAVKTGTTTDQRTIAGASQAEIDRQNLIDQFIQQNFADLAGKDPLEQQRDISNAFQGILKNFISKDFSATPTAEDIASAERFVDETFTRPAEVRFERFAQEFQGAQDVRGAALGRQPGDIGFQAELFGTLAQKQQDIAIQRGALVQEQALGLRQQGLQNITDQLGGVRQGAGFFTDQASNLLNARRGLLDVATAQQRLGFQERAQNVTRIGGTTATATATPSLGTRVGQIIEGGLGVAQAFNPKTVENTILRT